MDIREMYGVAKRILPESGVGNYFPPKQYFDTAEIRKDKQKAAKNYAINSGNHKKLDFNVKKGTFLEEIQKKQSKLPSPHTYNPQSYDAQYKKRKFSNLPQRRTVFEDLLRNNKKFAVPSPASYSLSLQKSKSLSAISMEKAANVNFLDDVISKSSQTPGVGDYYACRHQYDKILGKWGKAERSVSNKSHNTLPTSPIYNAIPPDNKLFSAISKMKKKNSILNKQKRFLENKENACSKMFYTGVSEWGLKTNCKKKDLLAKLSTHNCYSKSVYY